MIKFNKPLICLLIACLTITSFTFNLKKANAAITFKFDNGVGSFTTVDNMATSGTTYKTVGWMVHSNPRNGDPGVNNQLFGKMENLQEDQRLNNTPSVGKVTTVFSISHAVVDEAMKKALLAGIVNGTPVYLSAIFQVYQNGSPTGSPYYTKAGIVGARAWANPSDFDQYYDVQGTYYSGTYTCKAVTKNKTLGTTIDTFTLPSGKSGSACAYTFPATQTIGGDSYELTKSYIVQDYNSGVGLYPRTAEPGLTSRNTTIAIGGTTIFAEYTKIISGTPTLVVTPYTKTIAVGTTANYVATYKDAAGVSSNVTSSASWFSSSPAIATINTTGLATGVANGTVNITASYSGLTASAELIVYSGTPPPTPTPTPAPTATPTPGPTSNPNNRPPNFKVGFVDPNYPRVALSQVVVGRTLNLINIIDPTIPVPDDPDGDTIYFENFDFATADAWTKTIPSNSSAYIDGYHNIQMNSLGYHSVQATTRDEWGATTTRTASINVVSANPIPIITGATTVVEGRTISPLFSASDSYSPTGVAIDHTKDVWVNKRTSYPTPGTEIIKLDVTDTNGLASLATDQANFTLTVLPDLPPIPQLSFSAFAVRNTSVSFSNTSYSPDGDTLTVNTVNHWYDSNNDGSSTNEPIDVITMDSNKQFVYTSTKVGKHHFVVTVTEDWGKTASQDFILDVLNDDPSVSFSISSTSMEPVVIPTVSVSPDQLLTWNTANDYTATANKYWGKSTDGLSIISTGLGDEAYEFNYKKKSKYRAPTTINQSQMYSYWGTPSNGNAMGLYLGNNIVSHVGLTSGDSTQTMKNWNTGETWIRYGKLLGFSQTKNEAYVYLYKSGYPQPIRYETYSLTSYLDPTIARWSLVPLRYYTPSSIMIYNNQHPEMEHGYTFINNNKYHTTAYDYEFSWQDTINPSTTTAHTGSKLFQTNDGLGNVYGSGQLGDFYSGYTLQKQDGNTGNVVWSVTTPQNNYQWSSVFFNSDSSLLFVNETNIAQVRRTSDGSLVTTLTGKSIVAAYGDIVVVLEGTYYNGTIRGLDSKANYNQIWSNTQSIASSSNIISADGYLIYSSNGVIYKMNVKTGVYSEVVNNTNAISSYGNCWPVYEHSVKLTNDGELTIHSYCSSSSTGATSNYGYTVTSTPESGTPLSNESLLYNNSMTFLTDFNIQFKYKYNLSSYNNRLSGFAFKVQDYRNMYRIETNGTTISLIKILNGVRTTLSTVNYTLSKFSEYSFKINSVGGRHKVYVNGVPLIDLTDTSINSGKFGAWTQLERVQYSNVSYSDLGSLNSNVATNANSVIVGDATTYTTSYTDTENDPLVSALSTWKYEQIDQKFLNSGDGRSGVSAFNGQTYTNYQATLDKVGQYKITYDGTDDPNPSYLYPQSPFSAYRKKSSPYVEYLIVHRKPIASFTVSVNASNTVTWTDVSYDPDRWLSSATYSTEATGINYQTTRGIVNKRYMYVSPSGSTSYGQLIQPAETGTYIVSEAVQDEYGAWSNWYDQSINIGVIVANTPPTVALTFPSGSQANPSFISTLRPTITWNQNDVDAGTSFAAFQIIVRDSTRTVFLDTGTLPQGTTATSSQWTLNQSLGQGLLYQVAIRVYDGRDWSAWSNTGWMQSNRKPTATMLVPNGTQASPTMMSTVRPTFQWNQTDPDANTTFTYFEVQVTNEANTVILLDSGQYWQGSMSSTGSWTANEDLPTGQKLRVWARTFDGNIWSSYSSQTWFFINPNQPPTGNLTFVTPIYQNDTPTFTITQSDPDLDALIIKVDARFNGGAYSNIKQWTSVPSGTSKVFTDGPLAAGVYDLRLTLDDLKGGTYTQTYTFTVLPLGITGNVTHTTAWESYRQIWNTNYPTKTRAANVFWAGEAFMLGATVTNTGTSSTKPTSVTAKLITTGDNSVMTGSNQINFTGEMLNTNFYQLLSDGNYTMRFTVNWNNGLVQTNDVTIVVKGNIYNVIVTQLRG